MANINKVTVPDGTTYDIEDATARASIPDELTDLSDVTISSPTDGQVLTYDSTNSEWVNDTVSVPSASSTTPSMDGTAAVGTSDDYARADHVHPSDTSKQDILTFDSTPTSGSTNPVTSGGVYTAINSISDTDTTYTLSISSNVITLTPSSGTASSITLPVYSGGVS